MRLGRVGARGRPRDRRTNSNAAEAADASRGAGAPLLFERGCDWGESALAADPAIAERIATLRRPRTRSAGLALNWLLLAREPSPRLRRRLSEALLESAA